MVRGHIWFRVSLNLEIIESEGKREAQKSSSISLSYLKRINDLCRGANPVNGKLKTQTQVSLLPVESDFKKQYFCSNLESPAYWSLQQKANTVIIPFSKYPCMSHAAPQCPKSIAPQGQLEHDSAAQAVFLGLAGGKYQCVPQTPWFQVPVTHVVALRWGVNLPQTVFKLPRQILAGLWELGVLGLQWGQSYSGTAWEERVSGTSSALLQPSCTEILFYC